MEEKILGRENGDSVPAVENTEFPGKENVGPDRAYGDVNGSQESKSDIFTRQNTGKFDYSDFVAPEIAKYYARKMEKQGTPVPDIFKTDENQNYSEYVSPEVGSLYEEESAEMVTEEPENYAEFVAPEVAALYARNKKHEESYAEEQYKEENLNFSEFVAPEVAALFTDEKKQEDLLEDELIKEVKENISKIEAAGDEDLYPENEAAEDKNPEVNNSEDIKDTSGNDGVEQKPADISFESYNTDQEEPVSSEGSSEQNTEDFVSADEGQSPSREEVMKLKAILEAGREELSADLDFEEAVKKDQMKTLTAGEIKKGESKPLFVFTLINGLTYAMWLILYVACTVIRYVSFAAAQSQMANSQYPFYTVVFSSPLLTVLKIFAVLFVVILIVWMALMLSADRNRLELPDKRLMIAVMIIDFLFAIAVTFDIVSLHLLFT